jgi:hypothetical protein
VWLLKEQWSEAWLLKGKHMALFAIITEYSWFQTCAVFWMLYAFFWVIPWHLNFICQRFGTLCLFQLHRQVGVKSFFTPTCLWSWNSVPKRRHIKFRRRGITQKKAYNNYRIIENYLHCFIVYKVSTLHPDIHINICVINIWLKNVKENVTVISYFWNPTHATLKHWDSLRLRPAHWLRS